jgi:hypothetical protein
MKSSSQFSHLNARFIFGLTHLVEVVGIVESAALQCQELREGGWEKNGPEIRGLTGHSLFSEQEK